MRRYFVGIILLSVFGGAAAYGGPRWTEGKDYARIDPAPPTSVPAAGLEVTEIFSYGCPYCAQFNPTATQLQLGLPPKSQFVYVPASFLPAEDWPMFQRAYCTAQLLGIAAQTHDAIFDAVWKTGELAVSDPTTHRLKSPLPTIEDAARVYSRLTGISVETFLGTARSFAVDAKMRAADDLVHTYRVDSTPSVVVDGMYLVNLGSARTADELIDLVKWLASKESKEH
jgi:thiol:disulfide interchange protein DsbA